MVYNILRQKYKNVFIKPNILAKKLKFNKLPCLHHLFIQSGTQICTPAD